MKKITAQNIRDLASKIGKSSYFNKSILLLIFVIWTILILQLGIKVGFSKASYFFKYSDSYYKNIKGAPAMPLGFEDNDLPKSHGAIGRILQIAFPNLIIEDNDGLEKIVVLDNGTIIKKFGQNASTSDITANDYAIVIGSPNERSEINAKLIRILPPLDSDLDDIE